MPNIVLTKTGGGRLLLDSERIAHAQDEKGNQRITKIIYETTRNTTDNFSVMETPDEIAILGAGGTIPTTITNTTLELAEVIHEDTPPKSKRKNINAKKRKKGIIK